MIEARIIDRGRGPEIEGTRITVYDILDYHLDGWHRDMIADNFDISSAQVEIAIRYIDEHRDEVMAVYQKMLERDARGNPPELQAKLDALRGAPMPWRGNSARPRSGRHWIRGFLADINVGKQRRAILRIWTSDTWRDLWDPLGLQVFDFGALGLSDRSPDSLIWRTCQREQLVLITANRNEEGPDSLEATIRDENQPDSLPVVTIANANRVLHDRNYAEMVAERLLDYLIRIDEVRGTGRIYVP